MEDSNFSQTDDQSKFIVLPSQEETQQSFQSDSKMKDYLMSLPALQNPDKKKPDEQKKGSRLDIDIPSETALASKKGKVLVPDSEYDSERHTEHTEPSDYVSESEEESHEANGDKSEDRGDVTVIQKTMTEKEQRTESENIPSSESSFQSKNRSNLGSYDQCELYKTQDAHATGYRFSLFASSQEDMFATDTAAGRTETEPVLTPAEHLGSLHLSQKPMLVPETIEETGNAISPSPEVYGSTPIIIPGSPTQHSQECDETSMFDVNAASTLAENSKGLEFGDSSEKNSLNSKDTKNPDAELASLRKSPVDIDAALLVNTLVDDDEIKTSKTKRSKLSEAKAPVKRQQQTGVDSKKDAEDRSKLPAIVSKVGAGDQQVIDESEDEVILIPTGTAETQQEEQSEQLFLHLTPSQGEITQGQRSQGRLSLSMSCPKDKESEDQVVRELTVSKDIGNGQDESADQEVIEIKSQNSEVGSQRDQHGSLDCVLISDDTGENQKKPSQGEISQGQKSNKSTDSRGSGSQRSDKSSKSDRSQRSERSQKRREEKRLADVNDNPLVVWKEESDTDLFHLTLPKDGDLLHPADVTTGNKGQGQTTNVQEGQSDTKISSEKNQERDSAKEPNQDSVLSEDSHREEQMTIGVMQSESEPVTQPMFRLEKPTLPDVELSQEAPEDLFTRSSPRQARPHARYILEEEDSEDEGVQKEKTNAGGDAGGGDAPKSQVAGPSTEPDDETYVAQRLMFIPEHEESVEATQPYDAVMEISGDIKHPNVSAADTDKETVRDTELHTFEVKESCAQEDDVTKAALVQTATQTQETGVQTPLDINVVQKVTEYLQSGYSPRSHSGSSVTDISDLHGSEKSDGPHKTPQRINLERRRSSSSLRKENMDKRSPKSPKEIQDILNTYSSILSKKKKVSLTGSQSLQREVSVTESIEGNKDRDMPGDAQWLQTPIRRESYTSLTPGRQTPVRRDSNTDSVTNTIDGVTSIKPLAAGQQTPGRRDSYSSETSVVRKDSNNGNTSVTKQDSNSNSLVKKSDENSTVTGLTSTRTDGTNMSVPPKDNVKSRKDLSRQYAGVENGNLPTATRTSSINTQQGAEPLSESRLTIVLTRTAQNSSKKHNEQTPTSSITKDRHSLRTKDKNSSKQKVKRLFTSSERSERRKSIESSPHLPSGSFVVSTQKFSTERVGEMSSSASSPGKLHRGDTFEFHGTQSQVSPNEVVSLSLDSSRKEGTISSHAERTPVSSRKRGRLQHKKSGLKKSREDGNSASTTPSKHHVSFKNTNETFDQPVSQKSDITTATIGSMPSLPSSISSPGRDSIMSPSSTSSGSRQSVTGEISTRLSGKRMSLDTALPDTLPLQQGEEENYQLVTVETQTVKRVYTEITTTKKIIGPQGQILESSVDVKKTDPTVMEESTHKRMQYIYIASPSRSAASLTSGDLADISSSLSRSSVSSSSLGSKGNSTNQTATSNLERQTSLNQTGALSKDQGHTEVERSLDMDTSEQRKHSISQGAGEPMPVNAKTQMVMEVGHQKTRRKSTPLTPNLPETSVVLTPLGSTINKTGSYLHSRTTSMESPKTSSSLFTSPEEKKGTKPIESTGSSESRVETQSYIPDRRTKKHTGSSYDISSEFPNQDQAVSSSSPNNDNSLVPSSGVVGCRVIAKWKDDFYYPGTLKSSTDRFSRCSVRFDDGDSMNVRTTDILLIERLPVGQSVLFLTEDGDFESGMITGQKADHYSVAKDTGGHGRYSHSQVILSSDQAACIMADAGSEILLQQGGLPGPSANNAEVSLDNLVDQPRRSAKKQKVLDVAPGETKELPSTSRGRKRKIDELKPKATSTPTPKGKADMAAKRRKVMDVDESPIETSQSSPLTARRSPRKARDKLFQKDIGPLPTKKLFRGLTFLLTNIEKSCEQREFEQKLLQDSSLDVSTDESAAEDEMSAPFNKDHLKAQIEAGGGVCLDNFEDKLVGKTRCYFVSSTYQRTIKYLQCLACGIPCVSHMWLVDSCSQGHLLDEKSYLLPNGVSLEKRKIMEWKSKKDTFIGVKASVYSKTVKFVDTWTKILSLGQCKVLKQLQYTELDVIVTDSTCTSAVKRQASKHEVPLVSTEWIIQSLINNKVMQYDGHARYRHDFGV